MGSTDKTKKYLLYNFIQGRDLLSKEESKSIKEKVVSNNMDIRLRWYIKEMEKDGCSFTDEELSLLVKGPNEDRDRYFWVYTGYKSLMSLLKFIGSESKKIRSLNKEESE